jgi:catechol 2,3-dioxygenase-like lactoylglutathione lyase family enzyme
MLTAAHVTAIVPTTDLRRAREFFEGTLGLEDSGATVPGAQLIFRCGDGTTLEVYERATAGDAQHTLATWEVDDVPGMVRGLRGRGVEFEDYDLPEFKTEGGIATAGDFQSAWFKDGDGNILCIHSSVG